MTTLLLTGYFPITDPTWIFFVVLCIILLAPLVLERLHIPQIVGMVLAGVLIGPYGLDVLTRDSSFELFGQVGLYYIMFLAGLSMDTSALKRNRFQVISFGLSSFAIPFVIGGLAARYLLHFSVPAAILVACILSSHTLVSFPVVSRYGLTRYKGVTLSVVATMISLMLALFVLAGLAGTFTGGGGIGLWLMLFAKCGLFCVVLFYVYPRLIRLFFRTFSDDVLQYIFVLCLVFFSAAVSDFFGLEGVLGAFLAGLIFNRYIPEAAPLMKHIDFVGNALFIPYFLIGVGMLINVRLLFGSFHVVAVVAIIVVTALVAKCAAAVLASLVFRLGRDMGLMMSGLTSGHAAGALAMVMVGRQLEVAPGVPLVNEELMNAVVMLILFSCIFSAFVTTAASKRIAVKSVSDEEKRGVDDKMLVALSNPLTIDNLVNISLLMRRHKSDVPLVGVKLVVDADDNEREIDLARNMVADAARLAASAGVNMKKVVRSGVNVITGLTYTMKDFEASELIIGYHLQDGVPATSFGALIEDLLSRISRQIIMVSCRRAVNTLRCIHVVVPKDAELEIGFHRWLSHVCRLATQLDCRIIFYATATAWEQINEVCQQHYSSLHLSYRPFSLSDGLQELSPEVHADHLLVIVAARPGSFSYNSSFVHLPEMLVKYFQECSMMLIFPDQYGIEEKKSSFNTGFPYHPINNN